MIRLGRVEKAKKEIIGRTTSLKCDKQKTASLISTVFSATSVMASTVVTGDGGETVLRLKTVKTCRR